MAITEEEPLYFQVCRGMQYVALLKQPFELKMWSTK